MKIYKFVCLFFGHRTVVVGVMRELRADQLLLRVSKRCQRCGARWEEWV